MAELWDPILDWTGAICILVGAMLCLIAAIGLVRLPDVLNRMHAATKPQTLGLVLLSIGLSVTIREPAAAAMLFVVASLQLLSAPVSAQMVARTSYRSGDYDRTAIMHEDDDAGPAQWPTDNA